MISDILWGLSGALDAVLGLFLKITHWVGSSDTVTDFIHNHGVDRDNLARELYGKCADDPHKYFNKVGPALCKEDHGVFNLQSNLSSDLDPKSAAYGEGNPLTEFVDNSLKPSETPEAPSTTDSAKAS